MNKKELTWEVTTTGCWTVNSHKPKRNGHIQIGVNGKREYAHRIAYVEKFGEIPDGMIVRHKCDNPPCINPDHLELGTQKQNMQDMKERGRSLRGSRNNKSVLSESQVLIVKKRLRNGDSQYKIADDLNVSRSTIKHIANGTTWGHLNE